MAPGHPVWEPSAVGFLTDQRRHRVQDLAVNRHEVSPSIPVALLWNKAYSPLASYPRCSPLPLAVAVRTNHVVPQESPSRSSTRDGTSTRRHSKVPVCRHGEATDLLCT